MPMTDETDLPRGEARHYGQTTSDVVVDLHEYKQAKNPPPVTFHRRELDLILKVYGRMVGEGEWRDYAIDHRRGRAVFSVFRRTSETPLFRIVKDPALARRQGTWTVISATGLVLKRGHELARVLGLFDRRLSLVEA